MSRRRMVNGSTGQHRRLIAASGSSRFPRLKRTFARSLTALALTTLLASASTASAAEPTYDELKQKLQQLEEKVAKIEEDRTRDSRAVANTIESILRDAEQRSDLLQAGTGVTAGYDNGFFIQSTDGSYLLKPSINAQFRNVTTYRQDAEAGGDADDIQNGFEWRRLRFRFDGNAFSKDFTYSFVFDTARQGGAVTLLDAWGQYQLNDDWAVKFGQFKASVFQERNLSGFAQLAVERSIVDAYIAGALIDRVQGISLIYGGRTDDALRAEAAFHDGANSRNTNFQDTFDTTVPPDGTDARPDWGTSGRVEWKAFGDWRAYRDFSAIGNKDSLLVFGAGADFTDGPTTDTLAGTIDAQWEHGPWALFGGLFVRQRDVDDLDDFTDYGALAQVGYLLNPAWELFGRYDLVAFDDDGVTAGIEDTYSEITFGVNYYLGSNGAYKHRAKISVDLTYLPDGAPASQDAQGILATPEHEWVLRTQFQLQL